MSKIPEKQRKTRRILAQIENMSLKNRIKITILSNCMKKNKKRDWRINSIAHELNLIINGIYNKRKEDEIEIKNIQRGNSPINSTYSVNLIQHEEITDIFNKDDFESKQDILNNNNSETFEAQDKEEIKEISEDEIKQTYEEIKSEEIVNIIIEDKNKWKCFICKEKKGYKSPETLKTHLSKSHQNEINTEKRNKLINTLYSINENPQIEIQKEKWTEILEEEIVLIPLIAFEKKKRGRPSKKEEHITSEINNN